MFWENNKRIFALFFFAKRFMYFFCQRGRKRYQKERCFVTSRRGFTLSATRQTMLAGSQSFAANRRSPPYIKAGLPRPRRKLHLWRFAHSRELMIHLFCRAQRGIIRHGRIARGHFSPFPFLPARKKARRGRAFLLIYYIYIFEYVNMFPITFCRERFLSPWRKRTGDRRYERSFAPSRRRRKRRRMVTDEV